MSNGERGKRRRRETTDKIMKCPHSKKSKELNIIKHSSHKSKNIEITLDFIYFF